MCRYSTVAIVVWCGGKCVDWLFVPSALLCSALLCSVLCSSQPCLAVRAKLIQCERRADGSRLQEKALDTMARGTGNAVSVYLLLHVPDVVECSFSCPYAQVSYRVEVDFFLGGGGGEGGEQPLAWSMDIDVVPLCYQSINPTVELIHCLEPGAIKIIKAVE